MKKLLYTVLLFTTISLTTFSCEAEALDENKEQLVIDPEKDCPPNDRNCNGIPDDEE